jgi:hypothetical protein
MMRLTRHAVEGGISQLKCNRAVASRYEKLADRYLATIRIAAINEWPTRLEARSCPRCRRTAAALCQELGRTSQLMSLGRALPVSV